MWPCFPAAPNACRRRHLVEGALWLGTPLLLGLLLGLLLPTDDTKCPAMPSLLSRLSTIIGWVRPRRRSAASCLPACLPAS
jgi:hypothetical protein